MTVATAARAGPRRVTAGEGPWPLHEAVAARAAETAALAAQPGHALMARAGLAVAQLACALAPHARCVHVLAGPGNNGGDGLIAATWLHRRGLAVQVWHQAARQSPPVDAAWALSLALQAGVPVRPLADWQPAADAAPQLLIDALLGLGSERAPEGPLATAISHARALHAQGVPVLAVDLPSGLHPDSGQPLGADETCIHADATLALLSIKPGCVTGRGRDITGALWFDDLGVDAAASASAWLTGAVPRTPAPHRSHKGSQGDVLVVGGAPGMVGAAWLAARAALAAGAGRVYLGLLDDGAPALDAARPELMLRQQPWLWPAPELAARTVVCGCGGGSDRLAQALPPLLAHAGRLVLDADALNLVAGDPALQSLLARRRGPTLLTPHPLEAARLLASDTAAVQAARLPSARALAARWQCTVVLKGSGSVLAAADGRCHVNASGNAALASPGSGDVLAGWLGGAWAQQQPGADPLTLASAVVGLHGVAADQHAARGLAGPLRAAGLVEAMARADRCVNSAG